MPKILAIADDLTGAADCAAAGAGQGLRATVLLARSGEDPRLDDLSESDILSIDADTRCLSPQQAADTVADLLHRCQSPATGAADRILFKKLDSTLRGNIAAELAALLHVRRGLAEPGARICILMAPAFPAHGRTTVNGRQLVHGIPIESIDGLPLEPSRPQSEISPILAEGELQCGLIELNTIRSAADRLRNTMLRLANTVDVLICDAETDHDLRRIAEASMALDRKTVWAGSAGLAQHLPAAARISPPSSPVPFPQLANGPTLFVVGSPASVSCRQAGVLAASPGVISLHIPHRLLLENHPDQTGLVSRIGRALESGHDTLLMVDSNQPRHGDEARLLTRALAQLLQPCASLPAALVATGGETARAILDAWGIQRLRLLGEVEPGLPFSVSGGWHRSLPILTKAGGFGTPSTLLRCREFLAKLDRNPALPVVSTPNPCRES